MIDTRIKLSRAIKRTELAYNLYLRNNFYSQALRLYKANKSIYELLEIFLYECNENEVRSVCNYIFHLDDWFNQFHIEQNKKKSCDLNSVFVFERVIDGIPYPLDFAKNLIQ